MSRRNPHLPCRPLGSFALLTLLTLGGCTTKPTRPSPSPTTELPPRTATTRTTEELRVFRGPLSVRKDSEYNFGHLENIPNGSARPLSLFLTAEELARLETVDKTRPFEIRYWYHEEIFFQRSALGHGELVSIGNDAGLIIDRTVCPLHKATMKRRLVPVSYGYPMGEFMEAAERDFPHAAFTLGGCVMSNNSPKDEPAYACVTCEVAYQAWTPPKPDAPAP